MSTTLPSATGRSPASVSAAKPTLKTSAAPETSHRGKKQAALDQFSARVTGAPLENCQNLLRQAIYGSRNTATSGGNARIDEQIRSLIDPKETLSTSLTSKKCPESAALAVIACVYKAFGYRILTGDQIDKEKLTHGLHMLFGKEMSKIQSDVLGIVDNNFVVNIDAGTLCSAHYHVEVGRVIPRDDYNPVINA